MHVLAWPQRGPSIGCSMGTGSMWCECLLWAAFHGDGVALSESTPTFAARTACAQLARDVHVVGGHSSEAGTSRSNAFGWCQVLVLVRTDASRITPHHLAAVSCMDAASSLAHIVADHTAHAYATQITNRQRASAATCPCDSKVLQSRNHRAVDLLGCTCASCFDPSNACSEHVANSCSMGAGRLWWGRRLWAAFHGDGVARRDSTHTFAARAACAQLGRGEHVVGRSSEAGASRPNAFGWCTRHQD